jgi:hypothetical protein
MWHAYNLVRVGDRVTATTFRKVAKDSGTGTDSEKVKLTLTVQVEGVEFDPEGGWAGGLAGWRAGGGRAAGGVSHAPRGGVLSGAV